MGPPNRRPIGRGHPVSSLDSDSGELKPPNSGEQKPPPKISRPTTPQPPLTTDNPPLFGSRPPRRSTKYILIAAATFAIIAIVIFGIQKNNSIKAQKELVAEEKRQQEERERFVKDAAKDLCECFRIADSSDFGKLGCMLGFAAKYQDHLDDNGQFINTADEKAFLAELKKCDPELAKSIEKSTNIEK